MSEEHYHEVLSKYFLEMVEETFGTEEQRLQRLFNWGFGGPLVKVTVEILPGTIEDVEAPR